jgi:DNA-binding NarL/FixJ family response regulator
VAFLRGQGRLRGIRGRGFAACPLRMSVPLQISLVEDDAGVRRELEALLNGTPSFRCLSAYPDAETALADLPQHTPDLLLMDINLPGMSGLDCVRQLKRLRPGLPIVMLTVHEDRGTFLQSLAAGASAYLLKRSSRAKLLDALREISAGGMPLTRSMARWICECFQSAPPSLAADSRAADSPTLTTDEAELLARLAQGYSAPEIAAALLLSDDTVRAHSVRICAKLRVLLGAQFARQSPAA